MKAFGKVLHRGDAIGDQGKVSLPEVKVKLKHFAGGSRFPPHPALLDVVHPTHRRIAEHVLPQHAVTRARVERERGALRGRRAQRLASGQRVSHGVGEEIGARGGITNYCSAWCPPRGADTADILRAVTHREERVRCDRGGGALLDGSRVGVLAAGDLLDFHREVAEGDAGVPPQHCISTAPAIGVPVAMTAFAASGVSEWNALVIIHRIAFPTVQVAPVARSRFMVAFVPASNVGLNVRLDTIELIAPCVCLAGEIIDFTPHLTNCS